MKKLLITTAAIGFGLFAANNASAADDVNSRVAKLEQEIELLKRQQEVKEEVEKTNADKYAKVELGNKGFAVNSPDGNFQLKLRAYAQADNRTFIDNGSKGTSASSNTDQYLIRTARPIIEGKFYQDFTGRLMMDFGGGNARLMDAYFDYKPDTALNFRAGKFKNAIGLERWQSEQEGLFAERGLANNLVPNRDIGLMLYGEIIPQTLEYQLAVTNGSADLANADNDTGASKDITGRIFVYPFRESDVVAVQGLGVGVAASYGNRDGNTTNTELTSGYITPAQTRFFTYSAGTFADGKTLRINPQLYYSYGPLGVLSEYVRESVDVRNGATTANLDHNAYTATASYVLTGENASFDGVTPAQNFNWNQGTWGAFEAVARIGKLEIDKDTFPTFATAASSARTANEISGGINWHLNPNLKLTFDYFDTRFDGGRAGGTDRADEKVFISRAQFRF